MNYMYPKYQSNNNLDYNNINEDNVIFNTNLNPYENFTFSLDTLEVFCSNIPNFIISYDSKRESLYGREINVGGEFKLSGRPEFNIKDFELYNIRYGNL